MVEIASTSILVNGERIAAACYVADNRGEGLLADALLERLEEDLVEKLAAAITPERSTREPADLLTELPGLPLEDFDVWVNGENLSRTIPVLDDDDDDDRFEIACRGFAREIVRAFGLPVVIELVGQPPLLRPAPEWSRRPAPGSFGSDLTVREAPPRTASVPVE